MWHKTPTRLGITLLLSAGMHIPLLFGLPTNMVLTRAPTSNTQNGTPIWMHWVSSGLTPPQNKGNPAAEDVRNWLPKNPLNAKTELADEAKNPPHSFSEKIVAAVYRDSRPTEMSFPEDVDTPSRPIVDWHLPLNSTLLRTLSFLVFRVQIQDDGEITAVELLDVRPGQLRQDELNELAEWLYRTPMQPAIKNGQRVPSQRVIEIAFEQ